MKVLVLFYSAYGHIYKMAEAVAEGARKVEEWEVEIKQVPETLVLKFCIKSELQKQKRICSHSYS